MYIYIYIYIYVHLYIVIQHTYIVRSHGPRQRVLAPDGSPHRRLLHVLHLLAGRIDDGHGLAGTQLGRGLARQDGKIIGRIPHDSQHNRNRLGKTIKHVSKNWILYLDG